MPATGVISPAESPEQPKSRKVPPAAVTVAEALAVIGVVVLSAIGIAGLAGGYLGIFGWPVLIIGTVVLLAVLGTFVAKLGVPRIVLDPIGLGIAAAAAILAAFMFLPGFHYGGGDRDPGVYMEVGAHLANTGSLRVISEALATDGLPVQPVGPGALLSGLWISDPATGTITPQFYHLWSALLGTAYLAHGIGGASNLTPLVGVLSVVVAVLIGRRLGGWFTAAATGLLLSTNMMQVWQAKYPSTEILAQALFLGMLLCLIVAIKTRARSAALLAGVLAGVGYLARPDGVLIICVAVVVLGALFILRRWDARATWFTGGMGVVSVFAVYQAYVVSAKYTNDTLPSAVLIFGAIAAVAVGSIALRYLLANRVDTINGWVGSRTIQRRVGIAIVALGALVFTFYVVRPRFGEITMNYNGRIIRSFAEQSLYWISWFFTWPGLLLAFVGACAVVLRRWRATAWAVLLPLGLFFPLYLWNARNSPYLMWWGRRFVPVIVPSLVLMIAIALALVWLTRRVWWTIALRVLSGAAVLGLTAVFLSQSLPLRHHDEQAGVYFIGKDIASVAPEGQAVIVWDDSFPCCGSPTSFLAGPVWLTHGQTSLLLPNDRKRTKEFLDAYFARWPDRELFVVLPRDTVPEEYGSQFDSYELTPVRRIQTTVPLWRTSTTSRPDSAQQIAWNFTVYRVTQR